MTLKLNRNSSGFHYVKASCCSDFLKEKKKTCKWKAQLTKELTVEATTYRRVCPWPENSRADLFPRTWITRDKNKCGREASEGPEEVLLSAFPVLVGRFCDWRLISVPLCPYCRMREGQKRWTQRSLPVLRFPGAKCEGFWICFSKWSLVPSFGLSSVSFLQLKYTECWPGKLTGQWSWDQGVLNKRLEQEMSHSGQEAESLSQDVMLWLISKASCACVWCWVQCGVPGKTSHCGARELFVAMGAGILCGRGQSRQEPDFV